jgi:hypothetical protein
MMHVLFNATVVMQQGHSKHNTQQVAPASMLGIA